MHCSIKAKLESNWIGKPKLSVPQLVLHVCTCKSNEADDHTTIVMQMQSYLMAPHMVTTWRSGKILN